MSSYLALARLLKSLPLSDDTNSQIFSYLQSPTAEIISKINSKYNPDLRWTSQTINCLPDSKCNVTNYYGRPPTPCKHCCIVGAYYDIEEYIWGVEEFVCRQTFIDIMQEEYMNKGKGVSEVKFGQWHRRYLRIYSGQ